MQQVYPLITSAKKSGRKLLALLIDPDKAHGALFEQTLDLLNEGHADMVLVGGSLLTNGHFENCITRLRAETKVPVVIFPGNIMQISAQAHAILLLSLISGRNPDLLIGKHVLAAPMLKQSKLEIISTGYMLIDGGNLTSVQYMSNTMPIPHNKADIASCTALAGEMLGHKLIYMDAGSGALNHVSAKMIQAVNKEIKVPLFVGGGISKASQATECLSAGADVLVVGTAAEKDPSIIKEIASAVKRFN
jgi:putative glycerol-1-phosphate prenyltransferase